MAYKPITSNLFYIKDTKTFKQKWFLGGRGGSEDLKVGLKGITKFFEKGGFWKKMESLFDESLLFFPKMRGG